MTNALAFSKRRLTPVWYCNCDDHRFSGKLALSRKKRRGNYIQYFVITYKGKESENIDIYVCVKLNNFAVHLKLTWHCKSAILKFKKEKKRQKKQCTSNPQTEMSRTENTLQEHGLWVRPSFIHPVKILMIEGRVFRHESKKIWLPCLINPCSPSIHKIIPPSSERKKYCLEIVSTEWEASYKLTIANEISCKK